MTVFKKLFYILFLFIISQIFISNVSAQQIKQAVIVNPIRGEDFWEHKHSLLDTPKKQYELISKNNLPATWLLRYDTLKNQEIINFSKSLNNQQELGLFLEITPTITKDAGIQYNQSPNWHYPESVFLIGYELKDREKLIDTAINKFKSTFGYSPKSVGAWWIDAYSLNYLKQKYNIEANLDVADQYSTDLYQIWGQYFSTPFYPSKFNGQMPASSTDTKIGVVTIQWATRDPLNGYGNGVSDSTYSVQANDYILHDLGIDYFEKLLKIYSQTTVGLENDFSWNEVGSEYQKQLEVLVKKQKASEIQIKNMSSFANYYKNLYPQISPTVLIYADDPLGSNSKVVWFQNSKYRAGWFYTPSKGSVIRDLRLFNDSEKEQCFEKKCKELNMARTVSKAVDDVTFGTKLLIDEGSISDVKVNQNGDSAEISYKNQSGTERQIKFLPNDLEVNGKIQTVSGAIIDITTQADQQVNKEREGMSASFNIMENLPGQIVSFGKFLILVLLFFLIPGYLISKRLLLSIPVGISLFTFLNFILGYLKLDILIWALPIISCLLVFKFGFPKLPKINISKNNSWVMFVVTLGSLSWLLTNVKSGLLYNYGMGFWGPNGHDGIWHLSLISELKKNIPPQNPIYAGESLNNYHYFFDLLVASSSKILDISTVDLLFRLFPLLVSILAGVLVYFTIKKLFILEFHNNRGGELAGLFASFFMYFGGSFGWVVSYFRDGSFGGESMFWAQQSISTLLNPPYAISLVLFLAGFYLFLDFKKFNKESFLRILSIGLLWGCLVEFKAYGGFLVLGALGSFAFLKLLRKDFNYLFLFIFCFLISLFVFLPNNTGAQSLLVYSPLWLVTTMVLFQDRLGWQRLDLAIQSGVLYKVILGNLVGIFIFILGNLGTRFIGFFNFKDFFRFKFLSIMAILGIIPPMLFIQKGTNWNIIQFFYYTIFILGIFAGILLAKTWVSSKKIASFVLTVLIILLTIPTTVNTFEQYTPLRSAARLSRDEIEALDFLKKQPKGIVMTQSYDESKKNQFSEPLPLHIYTSTAYVSAFSGQETFLEDTVNLDILGIDYKGRLNQQRDFARIREQTSKILKDNNISYLYIVRAYGFEPDEGRMGIKKIFENKEVWIFKVI